MRDLLSAYDDGALGPADRGRVEAALAADPELAGLLREHRALRGLLEEPVDPPLSPDFASRVAARVIGLEARRRRWVRAAGVAAAVLVVALGVAGWSVLGDRPAPDAAGTIWDIGDGLEPEPLVDAAPKLDRAWRQIRWIEESWGL